MSKRFLRKLAPGGVFARINMSDNVQSSHNTPTLPQPPPAKRAKKIHPQPDPLDPAVHIAKQPTCQAPRARAAPTNKGASNTSAEPAPHIPPGRRGDDMSIRQRARGDKQLALAIASSPSHTAKALQLIQDRSYATSGKLARESKFRTWEHVASRMGLPDPYTLSPRNIKTMGGMVVMANYRSAVQYVEQARLRSVVLGRTWTDNMQLAFEKVERASNRGIGPPRATAPYPVPDIKDFDNTPEPRCQGGPCWPRRADLAGSWWTCRSIELANAVVADVTALPNAEVSWELPSSKTDQAALGASRSRKCSCGTVPDAPAVVAHDLCPRCVLLQQVDWVTKVFKAELANKPQVPFFPAETGDFITKANMVKHIEIEATSLGEPTRSHTGAYLRGGHAYRSGIVHHLALSGVEVRYLGKSMAHSSAGLAEEAALGTTLNSVRAEIKTLAAQLRSKQIAAAALRKQRGPPDLGGPAETTQDHARATTSQSLQGQDAARHHTASEHTRLRSMR
jgi:hypothetical protein